ncbi:MAG: MBL fold metallo-hydrolase [Fusobacteriaceae bacterium]
MKREKITYIFNSGFIYEDSKNVFIFDFYRDSSRNENIVQNYLNEVSKDKKIVVFVSHGHHDHYSKDIFKWRELRENITYVISNDVTEAYDFRDERTKFIGRDESIFIYSGVTVHSFGSTDIGVSFLIDTGDKILFHGGDLNWWDWGDEDNEEESAFMEKSYKSIVKDIKTYLKSKTLNLAFFPVDPRLEERAYKGALYFIDEIAPEKIVPMHFGDYFQICGQLKVLCEDKKTVVAEIKPDGKVEF